MTTASLDKSKTASIAREVTDEEVAFYQENGWVLLKQLVSPAGTAELLEAGLAWRAGEGKDIPGGVGVVKVEPYRSMAFGEVMARNARRLINRGRLFEKDVSVRLRADHFITKLPAPEGTVPYHQDACEHGTDRCGDIQFWIALDECTPEMGTMRFLTGVHKEGPLGTVLRKGEADLLEYYPKLTELYDLTPPIHYQPGDATVHDGYMVHGSGPNVTDRPRISCILGYLPADTRFWNGEPVNHGSARIRPNDETYPVLAS